MTKEADLVSTDIANKQCYGTTRMKASGSNVLKFKAKGSGI